MTEAVPPGPTTGTIVGTLEAPAATDVPTVLTGCRARLLEREGIAMFVALDDLRTGHELSVKDAVARADGSRAARLLERYHDALQAIGFPNPCPGEPDVTGARELIDSLVVLSDVHLRAPVDLEEVWE